MVEEREGGPLAIEARTIRKLKRRILPFLILLYVIAYIDRINIGFAALTMNKELAITSQQFGLLAGIFFFGYFLFEVPSNLLLHRIGARIWIARILITWGILAALTGFVHSVQQLYVVRFLLGLAEAGYFPGIVLYLTYWFGPRCRAEAVALLMIGAPVSSIVGAPLSGLVLDHVHWLGLSSWRWLLILEGLPAIVCGCLTYFLLASRPADAKFLTAEEKERIEADLLQDDQRKVKQREYSVLQALSCGRVWYLSAAMFGVVIGTYTLAFWGPQLIKSSSGEYSNTVVGLMLMVPHLVGLGGIVVISRSSDRTLERRYHAAIPAALGGVALLLMGTAHSTFAVVALLSMLAAGVYGFFSPFIALPTEFLSGYSAAAGIALINSVGNLGGFAGPYAVGIVSGWTGSINKALPFAGITLLVSAALLALLPKKTPAAKPMARVF